MCYRHFRKDVRIPGFEPGLSGWKPDVLNRCHYIPIGPPHGGPLAFYVIRPAVKYRRYTHSPDPPCGPLTHA